MWSFVDNNITHTRIFPLCVAGILVVSALLYAPSTVHAVCTGYPAPSSPWGNGYLIYSGQTYLIAYPGWEYCLSNTSGYAYFLPYNSSTEHDSFRNAIPYISGLTLFETSNPI